MCSGIFHSRNTSNTYAHVMLLLKIDHYIILKEIKSNKAISLRFYKTSQSYLKLLLIIFFEVHPSSHIYFKRFYHLLYIKNKNNKK